MRDNVKTYNKFLEMKSTKKIGIDIHGVLDTNPFFKEMAELFVYAGHEVHIITGAQYKEKLIAQFSKLGIEKKVHYTHFFSIADALIEKGVNVTWQDSNNPWFDDEAWNKAKSDYCTENDITIHFDDSEEYAESFTTPFYLKKK